MFQKIHIKGLILCLVLTIFSYGLALYLPFLGPVMMCLLVGSSLKSFFNLDASFDAGLCYCGKSILALAVIFMGLKLKWEFLATIDPKIGLLVVLVVVVSISISLLVSKVTSLDKETSLLVGIGSGICGSSAIAASSSLVTSDDQKVATSLGVINFIGIFGLVLMPVVFTLLNVSDKTSAVFLGGSLQSLGHVAAAAGIMGPVAFDMALTIKMGRVFLLLPTVLILNSFQKKSNTRQAMPNYLWGFVLAVVVTNLSFIPLEVSEWGSGFGKALLMMAMVGIGYSINLRTFFKQAKSQMALAVFIQAVQLILITLFVM